MTTNKDDRRPGARLASIRVSYEGEQYERNLTKCRVALRHRQIEGRYDNMGQFARAVGLSLTTVSTWLAGAVPGRKETTDHILAGLKLGFDDVHRKVGQD